MKSDELKSIVKKTYGSIARQPLEVVQAASCCGTACCGESPDPTTMFSEDYSGLAGYNPEADLKLGCGIPTEIADIRSGDTVLDLGSGAGNDAFVARALVGERGAVLGVDMTEEMVEKARQHAEKLGFSNVEFRLGEIEQLPVDSNSVDVVISNCVLNLVPDKSRAFAEMFRVLKAGGHFSISDVVLDRELPQALIDAAELYAGCVSGALLKTDYLALLENAGFRQVEVKLEKAISLPGELVAKYLPEVEAAAFAAGKPAILSITVHGEKI